MNIIMSRAIQQQQQYHHRLPLPLTPTSPIDFADSIPIEELRLSNQTLGSGSFGTVFKGKWKKHIVAVKQFKTRQEIDSFLVEVKQLSCVNHPNIVKLYGASSATDTAYLVMEYAEGGSLNHLLHECKPQEYDLRHACSWAWQTAKGVAYLHGIRPKPIMHRDLKPANLLLFSRGKVIKICDFGTACTVKTQMTNNTGSASYMAPEVFATSSYLESADVFSWSIIFWEILARRHPYSQQYSNPYQILWRVKQEGTRPKELDGCPSIIWNLITKSWNKDPKMRPSMKAVADEMETIYSLTYTKSTLVVDANDINHIQQPKSPHRHQLFPISSPIIDHNQSFKFSSRLNQQQQLDYHHHQHHHHHRMDSTSMDIDSQESTNGNRSMSTEAKRESYREYRVALCSLKLLQRRAQELEESANCDKRVTALDLVKEFEELKRITNEMKRQKSKYSLFNTFNNNQFSNN